MKNIELISNNTNVIAMSSSKIFRRDFMKYAGFGAAGMTIPGLAASCDSRTANTVKPSKTFETIFEKVCNTVFIDTHEHLHTESHRIQAKEMVGFTEFPWTYKANDWTYLFSHYFIGDFLSSGIEQGALDRFYQSDLSIMEKWDLLEPYWPYLKHTGYGLNVRMTLKEVYDIDELNREVIPTLQQRYKELIQPGFYTKVIREISGIESCQVDPSPLFQESEIPGLIYSDLHLDYLIYGINNKKIS